MLIVDMFWGRYAKSGRRDFSCGGDVWDALIAIGKENGWVPMGTKRPEDPMEIWAWGERSFDDPSYEPIEYCYQKQVSGEDAAAWADALEKALPDIRKKGRQPEVSFVSKVISDSVPDEEWERNLRGISEELVQEFIVFLRKGPFLFTWDD